MDKSKLSQTQRNGATVARRTGWSWIVISLAICSTGGCAGRPAPADPQLADSSLRRALDAWVQGTDLQQLRSESPPLVVIDSEWKKGAKLVRYEVDGSGQPFGNDQRFDVRLTLDAKPKQIEKKAAYIVGTGGQVVVSREEE